MLASVNNLRKKLINFEQESDLQLSSFLHVGIFVIRELIALRLADVFPGLAKLHLPRVRAEQHGADALRGIVLVRTQRHE